VAEDVVIRPERHADHPVIAEVVRAALPGYSGDLAGRIVYPAAFDALGY
jgi:hypothetical protein